MEPHIGEIIMVGFNFAPVGWALCDGSLLPISENEALFSLIGTTYGGDGQSNFALPDLRGNIPIHQGQGMGLTQRAMGDRVGSETVTLVINELPAHSHTVQATSNAANTANPAGNILASVTARPLYDNTAPSAMNTASIGVTGGGQAHNNMQPALCVNFIISLEGIYPSQS